MADAPIDQLRQKIASLEIENDYLKREKKSTDMHLKHLVSHQYHSRAASDAGVLEILDFLHRLDMERIQDKKRSTEQTQQTASSYLKIIECMEKLSIEVSSMREDLRDIKQYDATIDGTTCGTRTPNSIGHDDVATDREELLDFGVTAIDDIDLKKHDWDIDLPELHASSTFSYHDAAGNKLPVPLSAERVESDDECDIRLIPRYHYERLLNAACFTEDITADKLVAHWASYAQRHGLLSAEQWREYYEMLVRPAYYARIASNKADQASDKASSAIDYNAIKKTTTRVAEMWFEGQRAELEYEDKEEGEPLPAKPVKSGKEEQLREARAFMASATRGRYRASGGYNDPYAPRHRATYNAVCIVQPNGAPFVLLQGISTTVTPEAITAAFKLDGIATVQIAQTASMKTHPPIDGNSAYFAFKSGEGADTFYKKLAAHAPALHEFHGDTHTFKLSLHASDATLLAHCRL